MREAVRHCKVALPCDQVWEYLADYGNVLHLATGARSAKLTRGQHGDVGAKYVASVNWEGIPSTFPAVLVDADPGRSLTYAGKSAGVTSSLQFDLTPMGASMTRVDASTHLAMGRATLPLEPFGWALLERLLDRMMRKLHGLTARELLGQAPTTADDALVL